MIFWTVAVGIGLAWKPPNMAVVVGGLLSVQSFMADVVPLEDMACLPLGSERSSLPINIS